MVEEGYDLVIRVNPKPEENLVGRAFLRDRLVVVASPSVKRPRNDAAVPAVVRGTADQAMFWDLKTSKGSTRIAVDPIKRLSSMIMLRDAVRVGAGVGRLADIAGQSRHRCRQARTLG